MKNILIIAPHADDETLGCGGSIQKWGHQGLTIHWLIVTSMSEAAGFDKIAIDRRQKEIQEASNFYGFASTISLDKRPASLTEHDLPSLIGSIGAIIKDLSIDTLVLPFRYDAHSDHRIVFDAGIACSKTFRYPTVKSVLVYETLSETHYGLDTSTNAFVPNYYVDISSFLDKKSKAMEIYASEVGAHPFPRSLKSIDALATIRGAEAGCEAAEAFVLLKSIN